jgi:hypothetical protein
MNTFFFKAAFAHIWSARVVTWASLLVNRFPDTKDGPLLMISAFLFTPFSFCIDIYETGRRLSGFPTSF